MPKPKQQGNRSGMSASQMSGSELEAHRTILGLDRPKPFDALTQKEQIQVLRKEAQNTRKRISQQSQTISKLLRMFRAHSHTNKGRVYLELQDAEYLNTDNQELSGASEFDTLR